MTPYQPPNCYPFSVRLIMEFTAREHPNKLSQAKHEFVEKMTASGNTVNAVVDHKEASLKHPLSRRRVFHGVSGVNRPHEFSKISLGPAKAPCYMPCERPMAGQG
jgi:hypothetical protein